MSKAYVDNRSRAIELITRVMRVNEQNKGKEFFRHEYDLASHIFNAITAEFDLRKIPEKKTEKE